MSDPILGLSQDHDPTTARIKPVPQRTEDRPGRQRHEVSQPGPQHTQSCPVVSCVRYEEDQVPVRIVAQLAAEAAFHRLSVVDIRLRFDPASPGPWAITADDAVPSAQVARDRQRHLGPPAETEVEPDPQPFQQSELGAVAEGVARWVDPQGQIQTHHGAPSSERVDLDPSQPAVLEAPELTSRRPRRCSRGAEAESGPDPCPPMVLASASQRLGSPSSPSLRRSFSGGHRPRWSHPRLYGRSTGKSDRRWWGLSRVAGQAAAGASRGRRQGAFVGSLSRVPGHPEAGLSLSARAPTFVRPLARHGGQAASGRMLGSAMSSAPVQP